MAQVSEATPIPEGRSKKGLIFGLLGALLLGGGGFAATYFGALDALGLGGHAPEPARAPEALEPIGFVPLEPIMINLPPSASAKHLRFVAQLEVVPDHAAEVVALMPRIVDALNTYLRAVEVSDLQQPAATVWLRAQMLRRVQVVTGDGRVRDLLVTEFVLN
jgi:flagellar protein FliL